jgi:hypothetical protein
MANIVIDIAAEFTGKGAFKQAENSTDKLGKNLKSLAKTFGVTFGAAQVLAFGKASVQAAAADEKAQKQLALALKNVGLGRDVASSEAFIQKLQSEFGVVDDKLRPAYQALAVATGDTAQSQKLLQIALDISASTGKDLQTVTGAITKAYLGNNTALGKLGVGISKADLKTKKFDEVMNQLAGTFAGAATESANTFQGQMDKLAIASNNVKEIIGKGIIDAFTILGEDTTVSDLASGMEDLATYTANVVVGIAAIVAELKKIPGSKFLFPQLKNLILPKPILDILGIADKIGKQVNAEKNSRAGNYGSSGFPGSDAGYKGLEKYVRLTKVLTAEELKQLKAKQLKAAIDKANLALGKGSNVFDMEKIQLAAAEQNQAEQLGKVTSQAQLLQITNDLARLRVKQDIANLEDAIAAKDVKAIESATSKLNADLKIIGALTGQEVKLRDIESILKDLVPKDLINLKNLDEAIAKLKILGNGVITPLGTPTPTPTATGTGSKSLLDMLAAGSFVPVVGGGGYSSNAGNYASSGFPGSDKGYGSSVVVNVSAGTIANPDELTTLIQNSLISLNRRGDLTSTAGSL